MDISYPTDLRKNMFPDLMVLYAPAMDEHGFKFILSFGVYFGLEMSYSDVNQAFMYNDLGDALVVLFTVVNRSDLCSNL